MSNLEIHPSAQVEFEEAVCWYAERSVAAAQQFYIEVQQAIEAIRRHPARYARLDDTHRAYLLDRFPYYVAYRESRDIVQIVAIRHSSRNQDAWKGR